MDEEENKCEHTIIDFTIYARDMLDHFIASGVDTLEICGALDALKLSLQLKCMGVMDEHGKVKVHGVKH